MVKTVGNRNASLIARIPEEVFLPPVSIKFNLMYCKSLKASNLHLWRRIYTFLPELLLSIMHSVTDRFKDMSRENNCPQTCHLYLYFKDNRFLVHQNVLKEREKKEQFALLKSMTP
ncbi:hypothetical protein CDAR_419211 [Caerostris darwini]|uniref:Uncharacterized protein n=1 Tax=Caerostris darwini TaxID=1538125 RepID=A0AAV4MX41_9ARAC|nr:hypothetical protein CDAR_419211 [Caerostris darwini]